TNPSKRNSYRTYSPSESEKSKSCGEDGIRDDEDRGEGPSDQVDQDPHNDEADWKH
ncbi:hypothetical protein PoB_001028300, partial [Plakobranchus ocellatus]